MTDDRVQLNFRCSPDLHEQIKVLADVEGISLNQLVIESVLLGIEERRKDEGFRERIRAAIERNKKLLESLEENDDRADG